MRKIAVVILIVFFGVSTSYSQDRWPGYSNIRASIYATFNGGFGGNVGFGYWVVREDLIWNIDLQPGVNLSVNFSSTRRSLGNKNRAGSRTQLNTVISPITIFGCGGQVPFQSVNTFYFGNNNAILNNNQYYLCLGTNHLVTPKSNNSVFNGKFSPNNVYSSKNRSQQLIYIGVKVGNKVRTEIINEQEVRTNNPFSVTLNFYEDHMVLPLLFQRYADHYDRFFTGGGNLQFTRFDKRNPFQPFKISLFNEVYTGSFERDTFDYPDIYDPESERADSNTSKSRYPRYVAQDPGQVLYNVGRTFFDVELPVSVNNNMMQLNLLVGTIGGEANMGVQDYIHAITGTVDKINSSKDPNKLYTSKKDLERLHRFYPASKYSRFFFGAGLMMSDTRKKFNNTP